MRMWENTAPHTFQRYVTVVQGSTGRWVQQSEKGHIDNGSKRHEQSASHSQHIRIVCDDVMNVCAQRYTLFSGKFN